VFFLLFLLFLKFDTFLHKSKYFYKTRFIWKALIIYHFKKYKSSVFLKFFIYFIICVNKKKITTFFHLLLVLNIVYNILYLLVH